MTHFGRPVGFQWIFLGVLVLVGFLVLRWATLSEAQAQDRQAEEQRRAEEARARAQAEKKARVEEEEPRRAAPVRMSHFLERGKSYYFNWQINWQNPIGPAVVLEEPRDNWVKVRADDSDQWINLNTVHRILAAPEAKEKKDANKGAGEAKGTVKGIVTLNGKPVEKGKVTFHPENGKGIEAGIQLGEYSASGVPVGTLRVTIYGVGLPKKFGIKDQTPLTVEMKKGENRMDFDLKD
jgi:hypothetical protein